MLERPNAGLVLSTTARFYAVVRPIRDSLPADSWAWVSALQLPPLLSQKLQRVALAPHPVCPVPMLGVDGCESDFPSALPGGHIQVVSNEIDTAIDVCKASCSSFLMTANLQSRDELLLFCCIISETRVWW